MTRRLLIPAVLLALFAASCGQHTKSVAPVSPAPLPNTPTNAVKVFEWCWNNRNYETYRTLFTDDFRFVFATADSAGNPYLGSPWTREDELTAARHLFVGDATHPPAKSIVLNLDANLIPLNDPRPGKEPRWHKMIRTHVDLSVTVDHGGGETDVINTQGYATFFVVRGDSAAVPPDLTIDGWRPDSTEWFIERWQDETMPDGTGIGGPLTRARPTRALPVHQATWGSIKVLYR